MNNESICHKNGTLGNCGIGCELYCNGCEHTVHVPEFDVILERCIDDEALFAECYHVNGDFFEWVLRGGRSVMRVNIIADADDVRISTRGEVSIAVVEQIIKKAKDVHSVLREERISVDLNKY